MILRVSRRNSADLKTKQAPDRSRCLFYFPSSPSSINFAARQSSRHATRTGRPGSMSPVKPWLTIKGNHALPWCYQKVCASQKTRLFLIQKISDLLCPFQPAKSLVGLVFVFQRQHWDIHFLECDKFSLLYEIQPFPGAVG